MGNSIKQRYLFFCIVIIAVIRRIDMAEITYEITKELGVISEDAKGWTKELNLISWNEREPKFDIRSWNPDHTRMSKGISLTEEEMEKLVELFNERNEEDTFE